MSSSVRLMLALTLVVGCDSSTVSTNNEMGAGMDGGIDPNADLSAQQQGCGLVTCAGAGASCGPIGDGCGSTIDCGSCPMGQSCGGSGARFMCGGMNAGPCVPKTCMDLGYNCGPAGDGCGGLLQCGTCMSGTCGGGGQPSVCGSTNPDMGTPSPPPCTGLCLRQMDCGAQPATTVSGTVLAPTPPAYGTPDPLPNALVFVPNSSPQPFPTTLACDRCDADVSGTPLVKTTSGIDGKFTLSNVPCLPGSNIPIVIQIGRWRRQITIPTPTCCANTALTADQTRLPRNKTEGDIPRIAVSTGDADPIECVLPKIGIATSEFTGPAGNGRVHLYEDDGNRLSSGNQDVTNLYNDPDRLDNYDMVIFDCVGSQVTKTMAARTNVQNYANAGGRVYLSHYSYVWTYSTPPWGCGNNCTTANMTTADWHINQGSTANANAIIDTSFQKGADFLAWLKLVGATTTDRISVDDVRFDFDSAIPPGQRWMYIDPAVSADHPVHMTFNTPVNQPAGMQCGRVMYSDFHVNTGGTGDGTFPGDCPVEPLTAQEKVLEYMLFDLAACIRPDNPTCTPRTCMQQGFNCGPAGDGCGNLLDCGMCVAPQTCGGGGVPGRCGPTACVPQTCMEAMAECGLIGDGCGSTIDCGPCPMDQTCGGSGMANKCGGTIIP